MGSMADSEERANASVEPHLDQPPEKPLDVDGVNAAKTGTIAFGLGFVALLFFRGPLADNDAIWWLWVFAAGAFLGLVGIWYTSRRRSAYRAAGHQTH